MPDNTQLPRAFYAQPTLEVARQLLGKRLVRIENGIRLAGIITETEAYIGMEDQGCHARAGRTRRTEVMFGSPGHAYVYFTYGMHWMLNCVTEQEGFPAAVLLRAILPSEGDELIAERRSGQPEERWTDGPAKICMALNINGEQNGSDLCATDAHLFIETVLKLPESSVTTGPRVGLNNVPEPWKSIPWRFLVKQDSVKNLLAG